METVLVTGASGFVGQAVTARLRQAGYRVVAVVRNADRMSSFANDPDVETVVCDLNEIQRISEWIPSGSVQHAIHFAWAGNAGALRADASLQLQNVSGTLALVEALHAIGCKDILAAGTVSEHLILDEQQICKTGNMVYAAAKASACAMAKALCSKLDIQFTWCRLTNIYGPGNTTGNLMSYTMEALLRGERPSYSSAAALQDFMYVADCAGAILAVLLCKNRRPVYYIGTGQPRPLKDFLLQVRDVVSPGAELGIGERPDEQAIYREEWFSIESLQKDTGFHPQTRFRDGIVKTLNGRT